VEFSEIELFTMFYYSKREGFLKGHLHSYLCSFLFACPKRNEPKKKDTGNDNFSLFWQNSFGITLPKKTEVRAISGLPTRSLKVLTS
jgi:hypothetical protein